MTPLTDPETLRIPAFMRKRSLRSRLSRPLVLTALDRKQAGLPPAGLEKPRTIKPKIVKQKVVKPKKIKQGEYYETFSPPVLDFAVSEPKPIKAAKKIGTITHYYDKIKVGVLLLTRKLSVGDCITYETADGKTYQQIIESMEINRNPVFTAKKDQDVGIKLRKAPKIGGNVT